MPVNEAFIRDFFNVGSNHTTSGASTPDQALRQWAVEQAVRKGDPEMSIIEAAQKLYDFVKQK